MIPLPYTRLHRAFTVMVLVWASILCLTVDAFAQTERSFITSTLTSHGFVNVSVSENEGVLLIGYENRRYRSEARGLAEAIRLVMPFMTKQDSLIFLVRHLGKPMIVMQTSIKPLRAYFDGELSSQEWLALTSWTMDTNSTSARFSDDEVLAKPTLRSLDIPIGLGVRYVLGNFGTLDDNYRMAIDLEPEVRLDLPFGFNAVARLAIPLHNNLDDNTHIRPSLITLMKPIYLRGPTVASVQAGVFTMNRVGAHAQMKRYFMDGVVSVGLEAGYTQYTNMNGRVQVPSMEESSYTVAVLSANWRYKPYDLDVGISYGQFLYQDNGIRIDVNRSVGDSRIGFFAMETDLGRNMGFQFALAIPPRRYAKPIPFRVRPTEHFNIGYRFAAGDRVGRMYDTGNYYFNLLHMYDPDHVKRELVRYLNP
jgi:hypothetical protein